MEMTLSLSDEMVLKKPLFMRGASKFVQTLATIWQHYCIIHFGGLYLMNMRKFQNKDAEEVSALIATTLRTTNIKDYSSDYIENDVKVLQPQNILERARWTHFYVVCDNDKIIGCGTIGPYLHK